VKVPADEGAPGDRRRMSRRTSYASIGGVLAQGAAAGLFLLRLIGDGRLSLHWIASELSGDATTYLYIAVSTTIVFSLFGWAIGGHADELAQLATTDPLTGLFNARAFKHRFHEEIARAARYREPLSLLVVDVDRLKRVNDDYGHETGDHALRCVAGAIRHGLRQADLGARVGGDEFTIVAPNTNKAAAISLAERLRMLVAEESGGSERGASVSIGISTFAPNGDASDELSLFRAADAALYQAKREGGNRVTTSG
jgi:diguanylate cyclase (GGDEF)-like protein